MIIAGVIACALLILITLIIVRNKEKEYARCIKAADVLFKYKGLDDSLFRDPSWNSVTARPYVLIRWKDGEKQSYVFDSEKGIHIGYDPHFNQIGILDKTVSAKHCVLYSYGNRLYIQDLNSTNGTFVRHWLKKKRVNGREELKNKATIYVGSKAFKISFLEYIPK